MRLSVRGLPTSEVDRLRNGGPDSYGNPPQIRRVEGLTNPCRHCLQLIETGENKLVLAYMPFPSRQPYAETGPIFLHQRECSRYDRNGLPDWFAFLNPAIVRGYDENDWIIYETGAVVPGAEIERTCTDIFRNPDVAYIHIRSKYNCFQCRVDRA